MATASPGTVLSAELISTTRAMAGMPHSVTGVMSVDGATLAGGNAVMRHSATEMTRG